MSDSFVLLFGKIRRGGGESFFSVSSEKKPFCSQITHLDSKNMEPKKEEFENESESKMNHSKKIEKPHTETQEERQLLHPLERNDRTAFDSTKTVRLDFLTNEATSPLPRCQDLPQHAFSRLTGRSILASIAHGWFFQAHPDPHGAKLDLIKNVFAPRLRERYPFTDIQVFYDFISIPQLPRSDDEEDIFIDAIHNLNSMYVYADVVLFAEPEFPSLDMTVHTATVDVSMYEFIDYIDITQVFETTSKTGPQVFDTVLTCNGNALNSASQIAKYSGTHTFTYRHRPFGRQNKTPTDDRGWLFLERLAVAVKAAAADKAQFDDIVISNSDKLSTTIYVWSGQLREAAKKQEIDPKSLRHLLSSFEEELTTKHFTNVSSGYVARDLMSKLVERFAENWSGEVERQTSMSLRAREILLRWGEFSESYVKEARLLKQENEESGWMWWSLGKLVGLSLLGPTLAMLPFMLKLTDDCVGSLVGHSVWMGGTFFYVFVFILTRFALN